MLGISRRGFFEAVRWKNWKVVREGISGQHELYNLATDYAEQNDLSDQNPEINEKFERYVETARSESAYWNP